MSESYRIVRGTVVIGGVTYKAFEQFDRGPWCVVIGDRITGDRVASWIVSRSGREALSKWLASRESSDEPKDGMG